MSQFTASYISYSDTSNRHQLSPLPFMQNVGQASTSLPHEKTEVCLSILTTRYVFSPWSSFSWMAAACCAAMVLGNIFDERAGFYFLPYVLWSSPVLLLFLLDFALGKYLLSPYPVLFHRQRREVMFLRKKKKSKNIDMTIIGWEDIQAVIKVSYGSEYRHRRYDLELSRVHPAAGQDEKTAKEWFARIEPVKSDHFMTPLVQEWEAIRRFMEDGRDAHGTEWGAVGKYYELMRRLPPLPDAVLEWQKPIPASQWARPSCKLRWYNACLKRMYAAKDSPFTLSGTIEKSIAYPGDVAAEQQLQQDLVQGIL